MNYFQNVDIVFILRDFNFQANLNQVLRCIAHNHIFRGCDVTTVGIFHPVELLFRNFMLGKHYSKVVLSWI